MRHEEYISINEATPPSHINTHIARGTGRGGGGVAAIFDSSLLIITKPTLNYTSFESLVFSLTHPTWKTLQPILFVTVYRAPGPYSELLSEFSESLSTLVLKTDKVIIVGDFNIHVDDDKNLSVAFNSILDYGGFRQGVNKPTHCYTRFEHQEKRYINVMYYYYYNHTLDLVLIYGIEIEQLLVEPHNPALSNHFFVTFEFFLLDYKPLVKSSCSTKYIC